MRPTWAVVDLEAIAANVACFDHLIGDAELCAVVKADGYGHGAVPVANAALGAGATWLAVALVCLCKLYQSAVVTFSSND